MPCCDSVTAATFRSVLVAHTAPEPDIELFDQAATIASICGAERAVVTIVPGKGNPATLDPQVRNAFRSSGLRGLAFRLMFGGEPATLFEVAAEERPDLIVIRDDAPAHLVFESPYPVWLAPRGAAASPRKALVRIDLGKDHAPSLLRAAARIARSAGVEELAVANIFSQNTLDQDARSLAAIESERLLSLYRLMARTDLAGVNCTPIVKESLRPAEAALRIVREFRPDVVLDSLSWPGIRCGWKRPEAARYLRGLRIPLVNVPERSDAPPIFRRVYSRICRETEAAFG